MTKAIKLLTALPHHQRDRLMTLAREVYIPEDTRIFESGGHADRFWAIALACQKERQLRAAQGMTIGARIIG